jgi:glycosyltransferase involved in cell wall biosynthesis
VVWGVNLVGYLDEQTGLGEIARLVRCALEDNGIPYALIPVGRRRLTSRVRPHRAPYSTNIVCVNADALPGVADGLGRSFFRGRRTIGFWWWEVDRLPAPLAAASHLVDEIWVGSRHVAAAVEAAVDKPVAIFPVPIKRPHVSPGVNRSAFDLPGEAFVFFFAFSFPSVFDRKNPLGLIDAFQRAFAPGEGPLLVIKSMGSRSYPRELARLKAAVESRPDIRLLDGALEESRYHALMNAVDCYVSLHRAEGLALTLGEAMALAKPAIATGYSGNLEFMTDQNSYLVPYDLVPIPNETGPYPPTAVWAEPDLESAAKLMRQVVEQRDASRAKAERGAQEITTKHGPGAAASFVRTRLEEPAPEPTLPSDAAGRAMYELMWGPDLEQARPLVRQVRALLRPLLRPYSEHQRRVGALMLEALQEKRD